MSPEQASASSEVDGRSDVYSLACVLYEMLAGQPPFAGSTARSVMARHLIDPPPPVRTVRAKVSTRLEQVLMKAMEKVPVDRYAGAAEFRAALRHPGILDDLPTGTARLPSSGRGPGIDASTVASSRRGWRAVAAAVATIAVVAAVAVWRMNAPTSLALDTNRTMVFRSSSPTASWARARRARTWRRSSATRSTAPDRCAGLTGGRCSTPARATTFARSRSRRQARWRATSAAPPSSPGASSRSATR
ncbi:MAG: hypothetical protein IPG88_09645 [Gemmatimonadetes bacterium]|nr:hypothetical protein [Gemmatimonadota bacterium]